MIKGPMFVVEIWLVTMICDLNYDEKESVKVCWAYLVHVYM